MDPLQPIAPRTQLPLIDRAAATARVEREREQEPGRERRRRRREPDPDTPAPHDGEADDGRPHVDISV